MDALLDVAIVGYGPVGQVLAVLLGQRGRTVGVFERQPSPYPLPRACHLDHEVARILQGAGLGAALPTLTEPADTYEWRNAAGDVLLVIHSEALGLSGWPESNMFAQPELERALDARVQALAPVIVHRASEVVGLDTDATGATLTVADARGKRRDVRARWVVGCDGANSFVRRQLDVPVTDLGFFFDWLIVDVVPHTPRVWSPPNLQICDPLRPTTLVSGGPGRRRWEFMCLPGERREDLDSVETAWRLLAPWGVRPDNATLERHAVYTFQARWVDRWRDGRVLLAGDAAHQMPPFAGQGMCAGMRDAANLAWKLDLVLGGQASEALLDTYATERAPQVRQVIEFSIELGKVICVPDPAAAAARDAAMTAAARENGPSPQLPAPAIGPGVSHAGDALAGHLFPQGEVRAGGRTGRFDDVVGGGFVLVSPHGDPAAHLAPELAAWFAALGGRSVHVATGAAVDDPDGRYAAWFASRGVGVALQRPDFHVFGSAGTLDEAGALVAALRRALDPADTERRDPMSQFQDRTAKLAADRGRVPPAKLAHVVRRTSRFREMLAWYQTVLGAEIVHADDMLAFLTYDDEHHRIAIANIPGLDARPAMAAGTDHVAFTHADLGDLLHAYARLKAEGITPYWCINHGVTTSMYYKDPDGSGVEFQVDNFPTADAANAWIRSSDFAVNPIGVVFDPEDLLARYRNGEPMATLTIRPPLPEGKSPFDMLRF